MSPTAAVGRLPLPVLALAALLAWPWASSALAGCVADEPRNERIGEVAHLAAPVEMPHPDAAAGPGVDADEPDDDEGPDLRPLDLIAPGSVAIAWAGPASDPPDAIGRGLAPSRTPCPGPLRC